jgi:hypothetical protein
VLATLAASGTSLLGAAFFAPKRSQGVGVLLLVYWLAGVASMASSVRLKTEVEGERIVVTLPGTSFRAIYYKNPDAPGLLQSPIMSHDSSAPISRSEFEALAWKAANKKARELGWH